MVKSSKDNQETGDVLFNIVLRDYLRKNSPPSLKTRILRELRSRGQAANDPAPPPVSLVTARNSVKFDDADLDEAIGAAHADIDYADPDSISVKLSKSVRPRIYNLEPRFWEYRSFRRKVGYLALAASVAVLVAGYRFWDRRRVDDSLIASPTTPLSRSNEEAETSSFIADAKNMPKVVSEQNEISTPEQKTEPSEPAVVAEKPKRLVFPQPTPLSQVEFEQVLNSQLKHVWSTHNVVPKLAKDDDVWLDRVAQAIVGRTPTSAERESHRQNKSESRQSETVQTFLESEEFAIHWSKLLVEHFRGQSVPKTPRADLARFVGWVRSNLENNVAIGSIERQLIEGTIEKDEPASIWMNEMENALIAATRELRTLSNIPRLQADPNLTALGLAGRLLHQCGNGTAVCLQCHARNSEQLKSIEEPNVAFETEYWSFPAAMKLTAAKRKSKDAVLTPSDSEFFYESNDGQLKLATPSLKLGSTESATIQEWVEQSAMARLGLVETIWTKLLQQPLVPDYGLTEREGQLERRDLKELLAKQLQATGDIRTLIRAIVMSDVFRVADASLTESWYLKATDDTIARYHRDVRLFAFVPGTAVRSQPQKWRSTGQIAKWMEVKKERDSNLAALAQPDTFVLPSFSTKKMTELDEGDQVRFLLSVARPYEGLQQLANKLAESNLSWNDQVNHMQLFLTGHYPTTNDRSEANSYLNLARQNRTQALILMATSHLGSF